MSLLDFEEKSGENGLDLIYIDQRAPENANAFSRNEPEQYSQGNEVITEAFPVQYYHITK